MPDDSSRCKACGATLRHPKFSHVRSYNDPKANPRGPLVYMIEVMTAGRRMTKIGYTAGPLHERVRTIQTSTPGKIVVRGWFYGDQSCEAMLHEYAHDWWKHAHGEWFDSTERPGQFDGFLAVIATGCRHELLKFSHTMAAEEFERDWQERFLRYAADEQHKANARALAKAERK